MTPAILTAAEQFLAAKMDVIAATGLAKDALHVHIGLSAFIILRLLWRGRFGWMLAWLGAMAVTLSGEWLDIQNEQLSGAPIDNAAHWHDIWNTMLWPSVLLLIGRWLEPKRAAVEAREAPAPDAAISDGEDAEQSLKQT